jgi:protein phosphatase
MKQRIHSFGATDVGKKRSHNEDAFCVRDDLSFVALADGVGGAAAGEKASSLFVETAESVFSENAGHDMDACRDLLKKIFTQANKAVRDYAEKNIDKKGMGCTGELVCIYGDQYYLGHVGDSRTYIFSNGELRRIGKDHTLVNDQVREGLISEEEAKTHPMRHVIVRAVGAEENLALDIVSGKIRDGDIVLLCSDGLTDMVDDALIIEILKSTGALDEKVHKLIAMANSLGGRDNITVVLTQVNKERAHNE